MSLAAGFSVTWNGIDGWLYFLAAVAFILAALAAARPGRWISNAVLFLALGLLLWVLTNLLHGG